VNRKAARLVRLDQSGIAGGCTIGLMFSRGLRLLLGVAVLAATGVASGVPCCTMEQLAGPASAEVRDCCDSSDCCRVEKRGPAQAALSARPLELGAGPAPAFSHPLFVGEAAAASRAGLRRVSFFQTDLPPPRNGRDTHLKISLLRI
jgi:hypothetical protein